MTTTIESDYPLEIDTDEDNNPAIRRPNKDEQKAATALAMHLRKIQRPTLGRTKTYSAQPPGRIHMGKMMKRERQLASGSVPTAEPFRVTHTDIAPFTRLDVGIIADLSGSMGGLMKPLASARWVLAQAIHMIQGRVASVAMGQIGWPLQRPGETQRMVTTYRANQPHENFTDSFSLIDAALDLIDGPKGAKVLVIMTDGAFVVPSYAKYAEEMISTCERAGVAVIWVTFGRFNRLDLYSKNGLGRLIDAQGMTPTELATKLGQEIAAEFQSASNRARR